MHNSSSSPPLRSCGVGGERRRHRSGAALGGNSRRFPFRACTCLPLSISPPALTPPGGASAPATPLGIPPSPPIAPPDAPHPSAGVGGALHSAPPATLGQKTAAQHNVEHRTPLNVAGYWQAEAINVASLRIRGLPPALRSSQGARMLRSGGSPLCASRFPSPSPDCPIRIHPCILY